jgi:ATP-dependent RNA helicase HelY
VLPESVETGHFSREEFLAGLSFEPDEFQLQAMDAFDEGKDVLVSAPTGAGKTLIARYAIESIKAKGFHSAYTTPLKALSNQKYRELAESLGETEVGLLTGDVSLKPGAPVVVMTTEVLRNMIHESSSDLERLGLVVVDEVHYLEDPSRGQVWEELMIFCPPHARMVSLSATVANADELCDWLNKIRAPTQLVSTQRRPVPLHQLFMAEDTASGQVVSVDLLKKGRPNPAGSRFESHKRPRGARPRWATPNRVETLEWLKEAQMLPAIWFVFSRAGCDAAFNQAMHANLRLTNAQERKAIRGIVENAVEHVANEDLQALEFPWLLAGLEAGIATHHAGMLPAFKEAVEECFEAGLVKVVFATETLALGINMPARTVVVERAAKLGGSARRMLTPTEYLQLTGRAGRRGLDEEGWAVLLLDRRIDFSELALLGSAKPAALRSAFRPTYNLTVNLVRRFDADSALVLLEKSFAQYLRQAHHSKGPTLAQQLQGSLEVLSGLGYLEGWKLTEKGELLARVHHERDLLATEALFSGLLEGLDPVELAIVLSVVACDYRSRHYRPRGARTALLRGERRPGVSRKPKAIGCSEHLTRVVGRLEELLEEIHEAERDAGLRTLGMLHEELMGPVGLWARGAGLAEILAQSEIAPGDLIRQLKQLADLLEQVSNLSLGELSEKASESLSLVVRGVVASR